MGLKMKLESLLLLTAVLGMGSGVELPEDPGDTVDGYALATVHILDPDTNETVGRSKRDIAAIAAGLSASIPIFLDLSTGERLNMTLVRHAIDTSGGKLVIINEDGSKTESTLPPADCFFSGPLQDQEGFANLAMCDGELMGSVLTDGRHYEIHTLPHYSSPHEVLRVLVTWRNVGTESDSNKIISSIQSKIKQQADDDDGVEVPEDDEEESHERNARHVISIDDLKKRKVTIEIADILDEHYVHAIDVRKGISGRTKIVQYMLNKWSGVAAALSNKAKIGWDINLRLVSLQIWKKNPLWYQTQPTDPLLTRMRMVCKQLSTFGFDHITIHTSDPIKAKGKVGLAWVGGVCTQHAQCAANRNISPHFTRELHEFGHSLGLLHDHQMPHCLNDTDTYNGFMGKRVAYFKQCYSKVFDGFFSKPGNECVFRNKYRTYVKKF